MAFNIPKPTKTYNNPMAVQPSRSFTEPAEGKSFIPIEIDWDAVNQSVQINVQGVGTKPFSQIVMLDVDNTQSAADVTFYFPDSTDTLDVPAYSAGLFPVFTSGLMFYAAAPAALATDVTRFRILNYRQEPIGNPGPQFHNVAFSGAVALATGTTALIAAGTSGTLSAIALSVDVQAAAAAAIDFSIVDHATAKKITGASVSFGTGGGNVVTLLVNLTNIAIRFASGIDLVQNISSGAPTGNVTATLAYRSP